MPEKSSTSSHPFDIEWQYQAPRHTQTSYSLVRVPLREPIQITYTKPKLGLNFRLIPNLQNFDWQILGSVDADITAILGLPVIRRRINGNPPLLSAQNLVEITELGQVDQSQNQENLLELDIVLPFYQVANLLYALWRPQETNAIENSIPAFYLGSAKKGDRLLPQKSSRQVKMQVESTRNQRRRQASRS